MFEYVRGKGLTATILKVPNVGADFLPFIRVLQMVSEGEYIFKIHTKSNVIWREIITQPLLASVERILTILNLLETNPQIGQVIAKAMALPVEAYCNRRQLRSLILEQHWTDTKLEADQLIDQTIFPGGAVFWARVDTLQRAFEHLNLTTESALHPHIYQASGHESQLHHWERMTSIAFTRFHQQIHPIAL